MSQAISFTNSSPRFDLPFLSPGQSQKEFSVNQAHALIDALLHLVVQGIEDTPPTSPTEGECWFVGSAPTDAWIGENGKVAAYQAGVWLFIQPIAGMRAFDASTGQYARFDGNEWIYAASVTEPSGGATVDSEARASINAIIDTLKDGGLIPAS